MKLRLRKLFLVSVLTLSFTQISFASSQMFEDDPANDTLCNKTLVCLTDFTQTLNETVENLNGEVALHNAALTELWEVFSNLGINITSLGERLTSLEETENGSSSFQQEVLHNNNRNFYIAVTGLSIVLLRLAIDGLNWSFPDFRPYLVDKFKHFLYWCCFQKCKCSSCCLQIKYFTNIKKEVRRKEDISLINIDAFSQLQGDGSKNHPLLELCLQLNKDESWRSLPIAYKAKKIDDDFKKFYLVGMEYRALGSQVKMAIHIDMGEDALEEKWKKGYPFFKTWVPPEMAKTPYLTEEEEDESIDSMKIEVLQEILNKLPSSSSSSILQKLSMYAAGQDGKNNTIKKIFSLLSTNNLDDDEYKRMLLELIKAVMSQNEKGWIFGGTLKGKVFLKFLVSSWGPRRIYVGIYFPAQIEENSQKPRSRKRRT